VKKPKKTISFRLEDETLDLLKAKASEYECSPSICARILLTDALLGQSYLLTEVRELSERQREHEKHFKTATIALLVDAGKANVEEAKAFVRENLA
jgi:hypothetical protein